MLGEGKPGLLIVLAELISIGRAKESARAVQVLSRCQRQAWKWTARRGTQSRAFVTIVGSSRTLGGWVDRIGRL